ncbi:beta-glucosidase [Bordetella bronchialis]|uniref:Beta-glucosidase n=1 Tax=Bordetella bronchialis TaxID=463025 RepID=A0A193FYT7_9BORD|nr:beta-glucosidase [Bordetella bronchialis]ANN72154.1 beta-glucosidase [Bordetella bronchialis]
MPNLFRSFLQGGFECSTLKLPDGRRLDLLESTGHASHALSDYRALAEYGMRTVRDGLRWHRIEQPDGSFDWRSAMAQIEAAAASGTQVIWDLCHYGWPEHLDIWSPAFPARFARYAEHAAALIRERCPQVPFYCPVNEISFWAWAGGEMGHFGPCATGRGDALKRQLVACTLAAMDAIRQVDARARFVLADPMIHVAPLDGADTAAARGHTQAQYQGWDMIGGAMAPELGGAPGYLDIVGVNFYPHNQWYLDGPTISRGDPAYTPMRELLDAVHTRYRRPILVAETGAEGELRAPWLRYVCDEAAAAMERGVPIVGICLYPVTDYPGWGDDRHCPTGLLGHADAQGRRRVDPATAAEVVRQERRFRGVLEGRPRTVPAAGAARAYPF